MASLAAPDLQIPSSTNTVHVQIIDTTARINNLPAELFYVPPIKGNEYLDNCPSYSFLITHPNHPTRSLLFDLGVRKDWENLAPVILQGIRDGVGSVVVEKGVRAQLEDHGVDISTIEGIVWSHWHLDHTGDPSTFPPSTALIVGPGFKSSLTPGYPTNKDAAILESDYMGRELREISFESPLKIGRFNAFDYFGDGSFYLLDAPGHAVGHLCALARVSTAPDSFIFMGGDACHHSGEFRPSPYLPFPSSISPNPLDPFSHSPCIGKLFEHLLRDGDKEKPFYVVARGTGTSLDVDEAERTIAKVTEADAHKNILVVMAHDKTLAEVVDFFPKYADEFAVKGWVEKGKWRFLKEFKEAVIEK